MGISSQPLFRKAGTQFCSKRGKHPSAVAGFLHVGFLEFFTEGLITWHPNSCQHGVPWDVQVQAGSESTYLGLEDGHNALTKVTSSVSVFPIPNAEAMILIFIHLHTSHQ